MASLRIVHSDAPTHSPRDDLHIWTPHSAFNVWWELQEKPLWVGVDASSLKPSRLAELYEIFAEKAYKDLRIVIYAGVFFADDWNGPCGCGDVTPCDYHRFGEDVVAMCGCSGKYKIKCPYHAKFTTDGAE